VTLRAALASIQLARGDPCDEALERLRLATEQLGDPQVANGMTFLLADRATLAGDDRTALVELRRVATGYPGHAPWALADASNSAVRLRDADELRRLVDELDAMPGADSPNQHADRMRAHAWLAALEGRDEEASTTLHGVLATYREFGFDFIVARTILDGVRVLGPKVIGAGLIDEARGVFERVGATPYLAWLDAAAAGMGARRASARTPVAPVAEASEPA
jgi:hypothetical protein